MMKYKIWIISKYATPNKYPRHFGIGMALTKLGYEVTLFASTSNSVALNDVPVFKGWYRSENHEGLQVVWMNGPQINTNGLLRIWSWFWFELKVLLFGLFTVGGPKTIVSSSLSLLSVWSGFILSRRFKARFVFEVRDIWPLSLIELGGYSESNFLVRFLAYSERLGYRNADCIIGTMPNLKEHVGNVSPQDAYKVSCVPQGVYLDIFENKAKPLENSYVQNYIPKNKFIVAYTGALNPNNPIDTLFEVAVLLEEKDPDIHFLIVGDGKNKESYRTKFQSLNNITFAPVIKKNQMAHLLSFVDVGYDAFSARLAKFGLSRNKWIDYMYCGCIIICSYDGYESMINEAKSGFFVKYDDDRALYDAILNVKSLPEKERIKMVERAKDFIIKHRTFDQLAKQYQSLLNE